MAAEAFDSLGHVVVRWRGQPCQGGSSNGSLMFTPSGRAGTNDSSGARFRVIAAATCEQSRGTDPPRRSIREIHTCAC